MNFPSRKNRNAWRKGNLQVLGNMGSEHYQTNGDERKIGKMLLRRTRKLLETKLNNRILIKHEGIPPFNILGTILKIDKSGDQTNIPENKKVDDDTQGLTSEIWNRFYVSRKKGRIAPTIIECGRLTKAWTAIDRLSIIWKSNLTDKIKRSFFLAVVVSILLYGCTTWTITKRLEKKLNGNYTRILRAILNKSWQQHPTMHQLYGLLPPITKTILARWTRHAGHCWRCKDELIKDVLLWTPTYGQAKAGRPARTQQLCEDTGCSPEDQPKAINDREKWRERVRDIRASGTTWWWWWY